MEVERESFMAMMPTMLKHISQAHFVAFDLELSGIPTRKHNSSHGRQTLQQRYHEVKRAAETFHILQVGLTCVEQDEENEQYLLRAYNFNLSPLVGDGLNVEREFTYSTGAVEFLLSVGYSMDAPYKDGVPYMTREETKDARKRTMERWDRSSIPDINIRPDDAQALDFMQRARDQIDVWENKWRNVDKSEAPYPNSQAIGGRMLETGVHTPLNRFEKRLAHQIVRAEYPHLQTFSTTDYVNVEAKDQVAAIRDQEQLKRRLDRTMSSNIGFRWLTDALAGEDLSGLDLHAIPLEIKGERVFTNTNTFNARMSEIRQVLLNTPKVLVGHNCFMDLVFIHRYFYGPLPNTVEEFQESIHTIFPTIIDTKFLSTSGPDAHIFRSSQLSQIEEALSTDAKPALDYPADHPRYLNSEKYHEAGYDSFVTSKVFLRLATRLNAPPTATVTDKMIASTPTPPVQASTPAAIDEDEDVIEPITTRKKKKKAIVGDTSTPSASASRFSTANIYSMLEDDNRESPVATPVVTKPDSPPAITVMSPLPVTPVDNTKISGLMPGWNSEFWHTYGNKLRVFGTIEEVCDLTRKPRAKPVVEAAEEGREQEEGQEDEDDEGGVELERRSSLLSMLQSGMQSLWPAKK